MSSLTILDQTINVVNGLFSLNDLHRVSGGENKHKPSYFMANKETKELIAEIELEKSNSSNLMSIAYTTTEGKKGGTFVCKELVYRYAMWISPKFSLMVIRAFDAMNTGAIPCLESPKLSDEQCYQIQKAIKQKCQHNGVHYQTLYNALYDKFKKKSYKDILASDFNEAMAFISSFALASDNNAFWRAVGLLEYERMSRELLQLQRQLDDICQAMHKFNRSHGLVYDALAEQQVVSTADTYASAKAFIANQHLI